MLYGTGIPMDLIVYTNMELQSSIDNNQHFINQVVKYGKTLYKRKVKLWQSTK
jgi:hypothetical protein